MKSITCLCENTFDADIPDEVDLDGDSAQLDKIRSGGFLSFTCPACGKTLKPEFPLKVKSASLKLALLMIPEDERMTFYRGKYEVPAGFECVIGYPELLDRVRAIADGFDHRAIEIMKYIFLCKAEDSDPKAQPFIFYHGIEDGSLCFHVHGLKDDGDVAVVKAPRKLYEMTLKELPAKSTEEPFDAILKPPYVSVNRLDMEE
jgi:hypothetical protein